MCAYVHVHVDKSARPRYTPYQFLGWTIKIGFAPKIFNSASAPGTIAYSAPERYLLTNFHAETFISARRENNRP